MTTSSRSSTSTGLEYGDPIPPEELHRRLERLRQFGRDARLLASMREELLLRHDNEWTAMHEGRFFHARDLDEILAMLRSANIDPAQAVVKYLTSEPPFHFHI